MGKHGRQWKLLEENGKQKHKTFPNQTIVLGNLESGNGKHSSWSDWEKKLWSITTDKVISTKHIYCGKSLARSL